jgi:hypothetical protein
MFNLSLRAFVALFVFLSVSTVYAQTKVVVIPLIGDDAASKWLGPWVTDTAYKKSEIIEFDGSSYIALLDHQSALSNIPPEDGLWDVVAASGANGAAGSIGDKGVAGDKGDQGDVGDKGVAGDKGDQGDQGDVGDKGVAGDKGDQGDVGDKGVVGDKGDQGDVGDKGVVGDTGDTGPTGPAGLGAVVFSSAPTVNDDMNTYTVGTVWIDTSAAKPYILVDNSAGAAVWTVLGGSAIGSLYAIGDGSRYAIGDAGPAGGIVFHVTDGGLHGLEAATVDQVSTQWGCYGTLISGANGTVVGTGEQNTADIIAGCNETTAASVAAAYGPGWYLPSKDELNLLYLQKAAGVVGGFASSYYWSSSQAGASGAWDQYFDVGGQSVFSKGNTNGVRAVRAF